MAIWQGPVDELAIPLLTGRRDDAMKVMLRGVELRASEIIFQTGRPVLAQVHGNMLALTTNWLDPSSITRLAIDLTGVDSIMGKLYSAKDFDRAVTAEDITKRDVYGDPSKERFRINVTPNEYRGEIGIQIVCRHIPEYPPTVEQLQIEPEIIAASTPGQGAVIIAGETGSGKTTTFAALIRRILENDTPIKGNLITYESPIEFLYEEISSKHSTISQHEIGRHLESFSDGVRNSLRRKPALIVIGELRDAETILAAVEASNTGHPIYSTTHANDVASVIRRMTLKFPNDLQTQAFHDVLATMRLIISQLLVPKIGGGRMCLREWQIITEDIRHELTLNGIEKSTQKMREIIQRGNYGQSMKSTVLRAYSQGLITQQTAIRVLERYEYHNVPLAA